MYKNTCILYYSSTEVYQKLLEFCSKNEFKIKESKEKFISLNAKKNSIFFWTNKRMELKIEAIGTTQTEITVHIYKLGNRHPKLENEYITAIEQSF